jgi:three-Cys-motif partner protein
MRSIHPRAYVLAFADIEAPCQLPWETVRVLKSMGHSSVDFYTLFPLQMAISRLFSYDQAQTARFAESLTRFFGTDEWREIDAARITDAQSPAHRRSLEALYIRQLETLWRHAGSVMDVRMRGRRYLYKMLFASEADAGRRIAAWAQRQSVDADAELRGQYELL